MGRDVWRKRRTLGVDSPECLPSRGVHLKPGGDRIVDFAAEFFGPPCPPDSAQEHCVGHGFVADRSSELACAASSGLHLSPVGST